MKPLLAVILLSCIAFAQDQSAIDKAKSACGPDDVKFDVKTSDTGAPAATPQTGKALVFLIGQDLTTCSGCGTVARVGLDGAWAGAIQLGSYMAFTVDPGEHHLCTNWQSWFAGHNKPVGLTSFTAEAGKVYYFRTRVFAGKQIYLDLTLVNDDEGKYLVASSPVSESHPKKGGKAGM